MARNRALTWLGICEPQNPNITWVRDLMERARPRGVEFQFVVPPTGRSIERIYTKIFEIVKPYAILLNDDRALFGSFENYNVFLQCCAYKANLDLDAQLFVLNQHYEKRIYRDSEFEWYTPRRVWSEEESERMLAEERAIEEAKKREEDFYKKELGAMRDFAERLNGKKEDQ